MDLVPGKQFKSFLVASVPEFWARYVVQPPEERHHYELIPPDVPVKAFFDLDCKAKDLEAVKPLRDRQFCDHHEAIHATLTELESVLTELFGGPQRLDGYVRMDASTNSKGSVHLVAPPAVFSSMAHLAHWEKSILSPRLSESTRAILDTGIYTTNRQFRVLWSEKFGKGNHLHPRLAEGGARDERGVVFDSLVSNFDSNNPPLGQRLCGPR